MDIQHFFDQETATFTYIVSDSDTKHCAIIDPVLNYEPNTGRTSTQSADALIAYVQKHNLTVEWILETHVHADHLTASSYLKKILGGKTGVGENIKHVLDHWVPLFDTSDDTPVDGSQFDGLFADNEEFNLGKLSVRVMLTPGHTPSCVCYCIEDAVFVGDVIFMPYVGTARADFPGGSAAQLYDSIQKILALPHETRIFTCHDYPPEGKAPACLSTVGEQKKTNQMIHDAVSRADYVLARNKKDENKPLPRLLLPSIQVNLRAGWLGTPSSTGIQYIKIPLNQV
jgi:glyoxylase-like metal-dependent hydrolase (beta-lactamase superfamily II)|tara:strand:+ start:18728 stop:19582 length:855 start_codon:yes stop_codon:yes gene_type:complete